MKKLAKQVGSAKKQTMGSKLSYIKKNWQLYVFFLMRHCYSQSFSSIFRWEDF